MGVRTASIATVVMGAREENDRKGQVRGFLGHGKDFGFSSE